MCPAAQNPPAPSCTEALPGEPTGASDGLVCTRSLISASTEPGRRFADYGDCDVVRSQRPYYAMPSPAEFDPEDTRLDNATYMDELAWLREEIEASACVCCHAESSTPEGAAYWDIEAGPLWIDTVSDEALAMITGLTDSSAFGFLAMGDNNGLDRSQTGIPTTDRDRLQAFAALEFERRGITMEQAAELPPFAPFFQELIDHEPEACDEGIGIDASGTLQWTGGGARYLWVPRTAPYQRALALVGMWRTHPGRSRDRPCELPDGQSTGQPRRLRGLHATRRDALAGRPTLSGRVDRQHALRIAVAVPINSPGV